MNGGRKKTPHSRNEGLGKKSLAVSYFHMRLHTIIGAESFHGPVRNGKGWVQLAMAAKHKRSVKDINACSQKKLYRVN